MDLRLGAHVPHTRRRIAAGRHDDIERRVQAQRIDTREVPIVLPHDFVRLEIPAFDQLVFTGRKEVRVSVTHREATHGGNVPGERELQLTTRHVPNLDDAVTCARRKPLVVRLHGHTAHPAEVPGNDTHQLPRRMVCRLGLLRRQLLLTDQRAAQHRAPRIVTRIFLRYERRLQLRCRRRLRQRRPQRHGLGRASAARSWTRNAPLLLKLRKKLRRLGRLAFLGEWRCASALLRLNDIRQHHRPVVLGTQLGRQVRAVPFRNARHVRMEVIHQRATALQVPLGQLAQRGRQRFSVHGGP